MAGMDAARARLAFEQRLARTYQQAVRARAEAETMAELAAAARDKLIELERTLASVHDELPMDRLARQLGLRSEHIELVWAVVACSVDARLVPHLECLGGAHARRGLSPAVYAMLAELEDDSIAGLAHWLAAPNPLVEAGLLVSTEQVSPAARAYVASSHLISFLIGEAHWAEARGIAPLRIARLPVDVLHDEPQAARIRDIASAFERSPSTVVVMEGPIGSGRVTACVLATGTETVVLDLARLPTDRIGDALVALRRESVLRSALPVLANVDHGEGTVRTGLLGRSSHRTVGQERRAQWHVQDERCCASST